MLPFKTKFGWGIGTLTVSLMFQANGLLLLVYLTDFVNMNATTAGLLIGLSKIYDAVTDPVMGRTCSGLVPQVTWGVMSSLLKMYSLSKLAPLSL